MSAMKQAKINMLLVNGKPLNEDDKVKITRKYLCAWEKFASFKFATSKLKDAGPALRMAGLKYMLLLLPTIWERASSTRSSFNEDFVMTLLKQLATHLGVERDRFFTCDEHKLKFRDRSVTDVFAAQSNSILVSLGAGSFNPLE